MTMQDLRYNGWANRETWVVNLHLDSFFYDEAVEALQHTTADNRQDYYGQLAQCFQDFFYDHIVPTDMNLLLRDLLPDSQIDWNEIAEAHGEQAIDDAGHVFTGDEPVQIIEDNGGIS